MLRGKALISLSARLQGFCPREADVQHLLSACSLLHGYLWGLGVAGMVGF